jgi:hypothetical protein
MCGIFGIVASSFVSKKELNALATHAEFRGKDSSGLFFSGESGYEIYRSTKAITSLLKYVSISNSFFVMGHSRLITNGLSDNQPVYRDGVCIIHNGIVVNHETLWQQINPKRLQEIDTEIIAAIASDVIEKGGSVDQIANRVLAMCQGVVACALALPKLGKLCLFSNNGSLYFGSKKGAIYFASESFPLIKLGCDQVQQVLHDGLVLDIPLEGDEPSTFELADRTTNLIPKLGMHQAEEKMLEYRRYMMRRCSRCVLPETMPFIKFNSDGVCNYCSNYKPRNKPRPVEELFKLVEPYRRLKGNDCIVPFSGGRDSSYALHLIATELKMKPIAYTYDWGMVTDLGRRNISRMCAKLGVENIIVAANIDVKRRNIAMNLEAWLRSPHLGMIGILTVGDKHFFKHIETIKKQTGISLNLWGVNPLEVTHFKAGFLGLPPDFEEELVYTNGAIKQLRYQWARFRAMMESPGYFNTSLWDTLSGEFYRSVAKKTDYYHIFDHWRWDEQKIDDVLESEYDWERAPDTNATWRIGDGTAAFYNYIYYTVAGFTEHDTFRSNQIREGDLTRERALELVEDENLPRYPNIKWYLDAIQMDFSRVISVINSITKRY